MGKTITCVGESGAGQIAKVANQIVVAGTMVAMSEALVMAQKAASIPSAWCRLSAAGRAVLGAGQQAAEDLTRNLGPGFKAYMQAKDSRS